MTKAQKTLFEAALARAKEQGVLIAGEGVTNPGNAAGAPQYPFWTVSSSQDRDKYYMVTRRGEHLTCTCKAGQEGVYCKHRALVTNYLIVTARRMEATERAIAAEQEAQDAADAQAAYDERTYNEEAHTVDRAEPILWQNTNMTKWRGRH